MIENSTNGVSILMGQSSENEVSLANDAKNASVLCSVDKTLRIFIKK